MIFVEIVYSEPHHFDSKERVGKVCIFHHGIGPYDFKCYCFPLYVFFFFCDVLLPVNRAKAMLLAATPYTRYMVTRLLMLLN